MDSFLIGKKLSPLKELLINREIEIIISAEITNEIRDVTQRPKLRNYFPQQKVDDFFESPNDHRNR